ncbi:MAG TPA: ABC transporter permease [Candidatus Sulfomarinibacteraceae bacterium]|nr:ABC transporter permease [Candidatus Sulfomarinibacteraceae bacterium]
MGGLGEFLRQTGLLGTRALKRYYRVPANPISTLLFPLMQLFVFSQLFKEIVSVPGFSSAGGGSGEAPGSYLDYLAPGQVAFTVFFATAWAGGNLLVDWRNGYLDKLRASPIDRYAILAGELVLLFVVSAAMAAAILALAVLLGAHIATGVAGFVGIAVLGGAFGIGWAGTSMVPALLTRNEQATSTLAMLFMPIAFMSTAFVPAALMPDWLRVVNDWNPISYVIEAMRSLMTVGIEGDVLGRAVIAIGILAIVLQGATLWAFRRLTA